MTGERIRAMRWWDIPQVHDIEVQCFSDDSWSIDQFWRELAGSTREYLVAVDKDHAVVGYAGVFVLAPDSDLQTVAVRPDRRGQKIGRELLDACVQVAKRRDATSMMLEVRSTNEDAIGMYEGLGFVAIATRSRYYPDGGDAVIMRLRPLEVSP